MYRYVYTDHSLIIRQPQHYMGYHQIIHDGTENNTLLSVTTTDTSIIPKDYFTVASTGTIGFGNNAVSKTITYISPVDLIANSNGANQKRPLSMLILPESIPVMRQATGMRRSAETYGVNNNITSGEKSGDTTGQYALQLTGQGTYGTSYFALMAIKWSSTYANFSGSWSGNNGTLSYDAQVKMYMPQQVSSESGYGEHYMSGMVFRLNLADATPFTNSSWLGVAYVLSSGNSNDYIPLTIPFTGIPMIILWQKPAGTSVAPGLPWIAYKFIAPTIYFNTGNKTLTNGSNTNYIRGGNSGARAQMTTIGTSDSGVTGELALTSSTIYSTFTSGESLYLLPQQTDITALVNGTVALPATSLKIDTGTDTTTPYTGILVNDIIVGQTSGASARVTAIPTWTGNWHPNNNAAGTVTITETLGASFTNNETLYVYRPSASASANFVFYDNLTDILTAGYLDIKVWSTLLLRIAESTAVSAPFSGSDVNDIRIYVGDTAQHGTPTGSPLDTLRYANLRWSNPLS